MKHERGKFRRITGSIWGAISAFRRIVANLLFILVIIIFFSLLLVNRGPKVPDGAVLVLSPVGDVVEQKKASMLSNEMFGNAAESETLLSDIIDVIDFAKNDDRIQILLLDLDKMGGAGPSKLQDIGAALNRFKDSGKQVIAYGEYFNQRQYYLAAHADSVYISPMGGPMGGVMMYGYGIYPKYFKTALEKLKVQLHVFRVGTYKSAMEPFLRDDMSDYAKEANTAWLNVLWDHFVADIAGQRGLEPDGINDYINNMPVYLAQVKGDTAALALKHGLVDALKTRDELRTEMVELVGMDEDRKSFKQIEFEDYLEIIRPLLLPDTTDKAKVGIIVAKGMIRDGDQPVGTIGGDSLADLIRQAREDENIKSIVLRIDSGGGSAFASELIRQEVVLARQAGKPVIVSMGSVAASGGYWIASAADEIWAAPTTITGSIGIFGAFATFEKSLKSLGIYSDGVGTTKLADAYDPGRPINPLIADLLEQTVEQGYRLFIEKVSDGRRIPPETVEKMAQGRVWSGATAKKLGLVDKLGSLQDAVRAAAEKTDLSEYEVTYIQKPLTAREKLIQNLNRLFFAFFRNRLLIDIHPSLKLINALEKDLEPVMQFNDPRGLYAYCLTCEVQ
jgi:protease-4